MDDGLPLHFISSAVAGFLAVLAGSPAEVMKSRCVDGMKVDGEIRYYSSVRECARMLYKIEGWKGFYAGFRANVYRLVLWNVIMLVTREQLRMRMKLYKQRK